VADGSGDRALQIVAVTAVCLLSAVLGVVGAFLSPSVPHVLGIPIPVGVLIAVVGNIAVGLLGARGTGSRAAPVLSALIWVLIALFLGSSRPEGDLVVTGSWQGVAFLLLGTAAAALAIGIPPRRRRRVLETPGVPGQPPAPSPDAIVRR
jgi:Family of unknown function (DUF6113)